MNDIFFGQVLNDLKWERFIPEPGHFYSSAGSMVAAATFGGAYGLLGRVVYPHAGITPFHYAIWFSVAFQIKNCFNLVESHFKMFMSIGRYLDDLEKIPEDKLDIQDQIRFHCWKVNHLRTVVLRSIDHQFSRVFNVRSSEDVTDNNVKEASFLEMCRFRIWKVFKSTVLDTFSSALAYQLTKQMGFDLPSRTAVPLFIVVRSVASGIVLLPSLHLYARFCNHIADELGDSDQRTAHVRSQWLQRYLPAL